MIDPETLVGHSQFIKAVARSLVSDEGIVEDLSQETLLAALKNPPRHPEALRGWLRKVVWNLAWKRVYRDRERQFRELRAARDASTPPASELIEREAVSRSVVDGVFKLSEPYRIVVLLRYYENLSVREIAEVQQIPIETVRTRLKRALRSLRARIDRLEEDERTAARRTLVVFASFDPARRGGVVEPRRLFGWGGKLIASSLIAVSLVSVWRIVEHPRRETTRPKSDEIESEEISRNPVPAIRDQRFSGKNERSGTGLENRGTDPAPPGQAPARGRETGTLVVFLEWSDGTSADGVRARVVPFGWIAEKSYRPAGQEMGLVSAEGGILTAVGLEPGPVAVLVHRTDAWRKAQIFPSETTEVVFRLPAGTDVQGRVEDDRGAPIRGAEIVLTTEFRDSDSGEVVAVTDGEGTFRVRDVSASRHLGARVSGYRPSWTVHVQGKHITGWLPMRLVLTRPGAEISGVVLGPDYRPVRGARVLLEDQTEPKEQPRPGGRFVMVPPPRRARTDSQGRFSFDSLHPARTTLSVTTDEFAPYLEHFRLRPGRRAEVEVVLEEPARLTGRIVDQWQRPVTDAVVTARDGAAWPLRFRIVTRSGKEGEFSFPSLAPGEITAWVEGLQNQGEASATWIAAPGEELVWDVSLDPGTQLAGRLVDEQGSPLVGWRVTSWGRYRALDDLGKERVKWINPGTDPFSAKDPAERLHQIGVKQDWTDRKGRFVHSNRRSLPHRLEVFAPDQVSNVPALRREGVFPSGEILITVPDSARPETTLTGFLIRWDGHPVSRGWVWLFPEDVLYRESSFDLENDGFFSIGRIPYGRYQMAIQSRELCENSPSHLFPLRAVDVSAGSESSLGRILLEAPGSLEATLQFEDLDTRYGPVMTVMDEARQLSIPCRADNKENTVRASPLLPGKYYFCLKSSGTGRVAATAIPFEVQSREETRIQATLRTGRACSFRFREKGDLLTSWTVVHFEISDEQGRFVVRLKRGELLFLEQGLWLSPGRYVVRAVMDGGKATSQVIEVREDHPTEDPIWIEFR